MACTDCETAARVTPWRCVACGRPMTAARARQGGKTCGGACAVSYRDSKKVVELTLDMLRQLINYDPETGVVTRRGSGLQIGYVGSHGYLVAGVAGKSYLLHRLAWFYSTGGWPPEHIDHINGDRKDNRFINLRSVSLKTNNQNERRARHHSKSGLLGAWPDGGRWYSQIKVNGRIHSLGRFETAEAAHAAYVEAKRRFHSGCTL